MDRIENQAHSGMRMAFVQRRFTGRTVTGLFTKRNGVELGGKRNAFYAAGAGIICSGPEQLSTDMLSAGGSDNGQPSQPPLIRRSRRVQTAGPQRYVSLPSDKVNRPLVQIVEFLSVALFFHKYRRANCACGGG